MQKISLAHRLVSADLRMVLNVAFNILPPDDRVIVVRFEELRNIFSPCVNGLKPFLAEDIGEVSLNSNDGSSSEMVAEDPERRDSLPMVSES